MALIRITRNLQLNQPLLNNKGERIDKLRLDGSFAFTEKDNEQYISFDRDADKWYINLDAIIQEITDPMQAQIDELLTCCEEMQAIVADLQAQIDEHHPPVVLPPSEVQGGGG